MSELPNTITDQVIGAAIEVHRELGPGLLESAYEAALAYELTQRGLKMERQKDQPVRYKGLPIDLGFRIDLIVDGQVIVELKAVESLLPIHDAQVLTYMKLSGCRLGLLINFNVPLLKQGLRRLAL
ncbi:MAG: GxxExxY protein [Opitutaceae bacterium]|nr:GxxExxY protein [Opitutaceae bacterium]